SKLTAAVAQERQLRTQLTEARQNEFAYQKDLAELTDREQRQRELNKILPNQAESPAFLSALQSVANSTGVNLTEWTPNEEVREQFYARVPMKLMMRGRYHQVAKFFYGVGQLDRIINMENISITQPKKEGDDVVLQIEALATAFRTLDLAGADGASKQDKRTSAMRKK
ncbi:MAG TPA: type 4a pilus biogenesis protein PilO, partial [Polyangiaceae bacterium]